MTGIIGSGFGLYGYVPAVLEQEPVVALLERAREKYYSRKDLDKFQSNIRWCNDVNELFQSADTVILAVPPTQQTKLVHSVFDYPIIKNIILEKPVAKTPKDGASILELLSQTGYNFRIAYSFLYTPWFLKIQEQLLSAEGSVKIELRWRFMAHHYLHDLKNWKRFHSSGGGVIRFFGIHVIALAGYLNFYDVLSSTALKYNEDDFYYWNASVADQKSNSFNFEVDSASSEEEFSINISDGGSSFFSLRMKSPFDDLDVLDGKDKRVYIQAQMLRELRVENSSSLHVRSYSQIQTLWTCLEECLVVKSS